MLAGRGSGLEALTRTLADSPIRPWAQRGSCARIRPRAPADIAWRADNNNHKAAK